MNIPENTIEHVVEEIKDLFKSIEITDEVLRQCKYDSMNLSAFLWNEYCVHKDDSYIEHESETKRCLFAVAEVLIKLVRESETFQQDVSIHISNSVDDINIGLQKISEYMEDNFDKLDADNQMILDILRMILEQNQEESTKNKDNIQKVKSRTQEYADKWNANMFLNDFDEWDEKAGANVKLRDVYLEGHLPHFKYGHNEKEYDNLDILLSKYIIKTNENKMLLILGQPGIGKSTLITWIVTKFNEYIENILVYKFADDLKNVDWQNPNVSERILEALNLSYNDLEGKTLILDGFDEVSIGVDRKEVLDNLYGELILKKNIEKFSLIITCRENYIQKFERVKCKYIILQPWGEEQIKSFCNVFQEKTKKSVSDATIERFLENRAILGIPLILYMVLALGISIERDGSIVDIYDKIFSLEDGGIYDRCLQNKRYEGSHRISEIKEQIHQISREIAIWMFENNPVGTSISKEEYQKICVNIMRKQERKNGDIQHDFLIGNYFRLVKHCEGIDTEELYFVHRTIYEYFVAETIYSSIENAMIKLTDESQEELAGKIVNYLKQGQITQNVNEFLHYKIVNLYSGFDVKKREKFYDWWESSISKMMDTGMFYYTRGNIQEYKNIIVKESRCFLNLVKILRLLWDDNKKGFILRYADRNMLERYIRLRLIEIRMELPFGTEVLNLSNFFLKEVNLSDEDLCDVKFREACLEEVDFSRSYLRAANLENANLENANLENANLENANLRRADIKNAEIAGINLKGANLEGTIFDENQVYYLKDKCNLNSSKVYLLDKKEVISYEEYCKRMIK